jgi:hypothetical protein
MPIRLLQRRHNEEGTADRDDIFDERRWAISSKRRGEPRTKCVSPEYPKIHRIRGGIVEATGKASRRLGPEPAAIPGSVAESHRAQLQRTSADGLRRGADAGSPREIFSQPPRSGIAQIETLEVLERPRPRSPVALSGVRSYEAHLRAVETRGHEASCLLNQNTQRQQPSDCFSQTRIFRNHPLTGPPSRSPFRKTKTSTNP